MAVFEFSVVSTDSIEDREEGTIVANDKLAAFDKLKRLEYTDIRLRSLHGFEAFRRQWSADVV
jgi:hypothetical protein